MLARLESNANDLLLKLGDPTNLSLQTNLNKLLEKGSQDLRDWWTGQEIVKLGVLSTEQDIQGFIREAIERIKNLVTLIKDHKKILEIEVEALQKELIEKFASDTTMQRIAELRANAEMRLQKVKELRDNYKTAWNTLIQNIKDRQIIADKLTKVQNEIAGIRSKYNIAVEKKLNTFLPDEMRVTIQFHPGGDIGQFSNALDEIFGSRGNQIKKIKRLILSLYTPISFSELLANNNLESIIGSRADIDEVSQEITKEDIDLCITKTQYIEFDEMAGVNVLTENGSRLEAILGLQEVPWDDHEAILLNGGPVNEKSPGQRSSAMLPLISLAEDTPLIIDQPEDNLDKQLIGNVLSRVLSDLKEKRQIIVCTHDPNILVGGDSEQVIVLEAESDRKGKATNHGSIDNDDIVETIINILEGGKEAFEVRRSRYKI